MQNIFGILESYPFTLYRSHLWALKFYLLLPQYTVATMSFFNKKPNKCDIKPEKFEKKAPIWSHFPPSSADKSKSIFYLAMLKNCYFASRILLKLIISGKVHERKKPYTCNIGEKEFTCCELSGPRLGFTQDRCSENTSRKYLVRNFG